MHPPVADIAPFRPFCKNGDLARESLDTRDGVCTRRELLSRFLLLCAVLDQGPDIRGVRSLLSGVVNHLYDNEIRIFHTPLDFFREMNVSVQEIWNRHEKIKTDRAEEWARANQTTPKKYNLFMDGGKQSMSYAVFRWGTPLALPYILTQDAEEQGRPTALMDYLEQWDSAEKMSQRLKDHHIYGLGKAIGDKACHLFAKWLVSSFALTRRQDDAGWGAYSFESPYDSNAGRVLWRTGYLLRLADETEYRQQQVVQPGEGKGGQHYIRVTKIRGMKMSQNLPERTKRDYDDICMNHLRVNVRPPRTVQIQRLQHALLMRDGSSIAEFDDGLIHVGLKYCHNHGAPDCGVCPLKDQCKGAVSTRSLIDDYRT